MQWPPSPPVSVIASDHTLDTDVVIVSDVESTAETFSTFSMTSSMEHQIFREDGGRRFQATNDDYGLPADEVENRRLDGQHYAIKALLNDTKYLPVIVKALQDDGSGRRKRVLDIGTGTGIWPTEMAKEFPHVDWIGTDLIPIEPGDPVPDNLQFVMEDVTGGIGYPDDHFDVVHARLLIVGIRDWQALVNEMIRVTRPGGIVMSIEMLIPFGILNGKEWDVERIAPGVSAFQNMIVETFRARGYDLQVGPKTMPRLLESSDLVIGVEQAEKQLPFSPYSDDPVLKKAGAMYHPSTIQAADAAKILMMDAAGLSEEEFETLKAGWIGDIESGLPLASRVFFNWAWKK